MDAAYLTNECIPYLIKENLISKKTKKEGSECFYEITETEKEIKFDYIVSVVLLYQERMKKISEIKDMADDFFKEDVLVEKEILFWKDTKREDLIDSLERGIKVIDSVKWEKSSLEKELINEANKEKDRGKFLWPIRAALTGKKASASPFDVAWVLGREMSIKRLRRAINALK